jgi:predicted RNase H-like HicB family nuclease
MRGVNYLYNEDNKKVAVQIDIKTIEQHQQDIEDLLDGILAEARKDEEKIPFDKVLKNLKKAKKLK